MWHLGKRGSSAHKVYGLNCSGDNTHLDVKPAQLWIAFLFVLEQGLEQKLFLRESHYHQFVGRSAACIFQLLLWN